MKIVFVIQLLSLFMVLSFTAVGQINNNQITNSQFLDEPVGPNQILYTSKPFIKGLDGSPYLFDEWSEGSINFKTGNKPFNIGKYKYDVKNNFLDIMINDEEKHIEGRHVKNFVLIDQDKKARKFETCDNFNLDGVRLKGFFEVIYSGNILLLERPFVYIKPATYNKALMIGERNDKIIIKTEYYYSDEDGNIKKIKKIKDINTLGSGKYEKSKLRMNRKNLILLFNERKL